MLSYNFLLFKVWLIYFISSCRCYILNKPPVKLLIKSKFTSKLIKIDSIVILTFKTEHDLFSMIYLYMLYVNLTLLSSTLGANI